MIMQLENKEPEKKFMNLTENQPKMVKDTPETLVEELKSINDNDQHDENQQSKPIELFSF